MNALHDHSYEDDRLGQDFHNGHLRNVAQNFLHNAFFVGYDKYMNLKKVRKNHCGGVLRLGFVGKFLKE